MISDEPVLTPQELSKPIIPFKEDVDLRTHVRKEIVEDRRFDIDNNKPDIKTEPLQPKDELFNDVVNDITDFETDIKHSNIRNEKDINMKTVKLEKDRSKSISEGKWNYDLTRQ